MLRKQYCSKVVIKYQKSHFDSIICKERIVFCNVYCTCRKFSVFEACDGKFIGSLLSIWEFNICSLENRSSRVKMGTENAKILHSNWKTEPRIPKLFEASRFSFKIIWTQDSVFEVWVLFQNRFIYQVLFHGSQSLLAMSCKICD